VATGAQGSRSAIQRQGRHATLDFGHYLRIGGVAAAAEAPLELAFRQILRKPAKRWRQVRIGQRSSQRIIQAWRRVRNQLSKTGTGAICGKIRKREATAMARVLDFL